MTGARWTTLNIVDVEIPRLLFKADLPEIAAPRATEGPQGSCRIRLTDLSRTWGEVLSRDEIVGRALECRCSIDPNEDNQQFEILIEKIRAALNHEPGTTLSLFRQQHTEDTLLLSLTAPLPAPLPELQWKFYLTTCTPLDLEEDLVRPLLHQAYHLQQKVELMVKEIYDKDRVISKITDRLETSGNDLTAVFPGVSNIKTNRKRSQREQLAKHVKGLGDFDLSHWDIQHPRAYADVKDLSPTELNAIVADLPNLPVSVSRGDRIDWWVKLGERSTWSDRERHSSSVVSRSVDDRRAAENIDKTENATTHDSDDDFQRQATPSQSNQRNERAIPALASANPPEVQPEQSQYASQQHPTVTPADDESTTDDDSDLDAPQRMSQATGRPNRSLTPRKSSTVVVDRRTSSPAREAPESRVMSPPVKPRSTLGSLGGKSKVSVTPEPTTGRDERQAKPITKLGTLGGRTQAHLEREQTPPPSKRAQNASVTPSPNKHKRLGVVGGKSIDSQTSSYQPSALTEDATPEPARQASPPRARRREIEATTAPRETSQERADRKRDQLKRDLEEKAKAPAKKKRRF